MNTGEILYKKREGGKLSREEIEYVVKGYVNEEIPDYQMSAFLMAIFFRGMDYEETFYLTDVIKNSGDVIDLSGINGIKVDKHSTGGVGDKTTLIVGPIAAACGIPVAKMSGRGLGFTGGTVDKLEAIPGFRTTLEPEEFLSQVNSLGISLIGQTAHITPADKKIYALRDVTQTVENYSLIASSIMSKKLAAGSDAIVLDVKCGSGAFMKDQESAHELSEIMVEIGKQAGKHTIAVITDMSQPLGEAVGNSLEVIEAIETLKGKGPKDITELSIILSCAMLRAGRPELSEEEAHSVVVEALESGKALEKLRALIEAQGGDARVIDNYSLFGEAALSKELLAVADGYVESIDTRLVGLASQLTGAGREKKTDPIDMTAGLVIKKKVGDRVLAGEPIAVVYSNDKAKLESGYYHLAQAFRLSMEKPDSASLVKEVIDSSK